MTIRIASSLAGIAVALLLVPTPAETGEHAGCLSCHGFPGLVRRSADDSLRVVHIDPQRFAQSAHGALDCHDCHTKVWSVPHVGETAVECTTRCHGDDRKRIADYPLAGFHQREQSYIVRLDDGSSCRVCHPMYPHSADPVVRTFLNMHTGYVRCEVCHLDRDKFAGLSYDWEEGRDVEFGGESFGTFYDPRADKATRMTNRISRIAVFTGAGSRGEPVTSVADAERARRFRHQSSDLSDASRREELDYFHRDVVRRQIGVACEECHSAETILDYPALGFDPQKADSLTHLNMIGLFTKYETFHFPKLF